MTALRNPKVMKIISSLGFTMSQFNDPNCWRGATSKGYPEETELSNIVTADSWVRYVIDIQNKFKTRVFLAAAGGHRREEVSLFRSIDAHANKLHLDSITV